VVLLLLPPLPPPLLSWNGTEELLSDQLLELTVNFLCLN
jgi:hypothetical protein